MLQGKVGGIQVLAGLAPSSQTVECNIRTLWSHQRWLKVAPAEIGGKRRKTVILPGPQCRGAIETSHFETDYMNSFESFERDQLSCLL
jgi:hypothetical protein